MNATITRLLHVLREHGEVTFIFGCPLLLWVLALALLVPGLIWTAPTWLAALSILGITGFGTTRLCWSWSDTQPVVERYRRFFGIVLFRHRYELGPGMYLRQRPLQSPFSWYSNPRLCLYLCMPGDEVLIVTSGDTFMLNDIEAQMKPLLGLWSPTASVV
jgi:hypothetical protein